MGGKYSDAKKYGEDAIFITVGLNGQDPTFTNWNGSIIPHQGGHIGQRIYSLDGNGFVQWNKVANYEWHRESYLFEALINIRKQLKPNNVAQACAKIAEGSMYH